MIVAFNRKCKHGKHEWKIMEISNALQVDDMGYPLRLVIEVCSKCGISKQSWIDVKKETLTGLDNGQFVLVEWHKVGE